MQTLPTELHCEILTYLASDVASISSWCTTCKTCYRQAIRILYQSIDSKALLTINGCQNPNSLASFVRSISFIPDEDNNKVVPDALISCSPTVWNKFDSTIFTQKIRELIWTVETPLASVFRNGIPSCLMNLKSLKIEIALRNENDTNCLMSLISPTLHTLEITFKTIFGDSSEYANLSRILTTLPDRLPILDRLHLGIPRNASQDAAASLRNVLQRESFVFPTLSYLSVESTSPFLPSELFIKRHPQVNALGYIWCRWSPSSPRALEICPSASTLRHFTGSYVDAADILSLQDKIRLQSIDIHCPYGEQLDFAQLTLHLKRCPSLRTVFLRGIRNVTSLDAATFDELPLIEELGLWLTEQQSMTIAIRLSTHLQKLDVWMFHDQRAPNEVLFWRQINAFKAKSDVDLYIFDRKKIWKRKVLITWKCSRNTERSLWASL
ncbi:hypothetical protein BDP27DRAFT_1416538 [Rhodocollybia butyracea]|uniref:F-box domain-containing protein n=1 Tax=Rhodocollybia butyracea TaxID=206335 RepID=A0A9P5UDH4_9AGAR|nr:hypothetical protein BDP27DRAFT_1416538 [Rhodocollybia butyracea]